MGQHLGVAKAAQILGISRHDLQRAIRSGDLHTFEGLLDLDELRLRYPFMDLNPDSEEERMVMIRATAFARRVREEVMPDADLIAIQLKKRMTELSVAREQNKKYKKLVEDLAQMLCDLQETEDVKQKELISIINRWILDRLDQAAME
jgi:CDP-4-dehydro-6-deoxyglucose reductase